MYILPEEPKESSPVTKWTLRLLFVGICIFLAFIFVVNIMSGTGEVQKSGIEQAMSDVTKAKVTVGTLKRFNIFPQFSIQLEDVTGSPTDKNAGFVVDKIGYAKSFWDWFLDQTGLIQDLDIRNLRIKPGVIGPLPLELSVFIDVPKDGAPPRLRVEGFYGTEKIDATLQMKQVHSGYIPTYGIGDNQAFDATLGPFSFSGKLEIKDAGLNFNDLTLKVDGVQVAEGKVRAAPAKSGPHFSAEFKSSDGDGKLSWDVSAHAQEWSLVRFNLDHARSSDSVWHKIRKAWLRLVPPQSAGVEEAAKPQKVTWRIGALEGTPSGKGLQGNFMIRQRRLLGTWSGDIADQEVKCGAATLQFLSGSGIGGIMATEYPDSVRTASVAVDDKTGKIDYKETKGGKKPLLEKPDREFIGLTDSQCDAVLNP